MSAVFTPNMKTADAISPVFDVRGVSFMPINNGRAGYTQLFSKRRFQAGRAGGPEVGRDNDMLIGTVNSVSPLDQTVGGICELIV